MSKLLGIVKEVFIPFDNINSQFIGFKVLINNKLSTVIKKQDEITGEILKDDVVLITKNKINNKELIGIEIYDGEDYE